jgi:hypothetical protein
MVTAMTTSDLTLSVVVNRWETLFLTLREEYRPSVFEERLVRRMFGRNEKK